MDALHRVGALEHQGSASDGSMGTRVYLQAQGLSVGKGEESFPGPVKYLFIYIYIIVIRF